MNNVASRSELHSNTDSETEPMTNETAETESDDEVECVECGDSVTEEEALTEINDFGPGPSRRFFCSVGCSLKFADGVPDGRLRPSTAGGQ